MRYSLSGGLLRKTQTKITQLTMVFVMSVTGLSGAAPLFLSGSAHAAPANEYVNSASGTDTANDCTNSASPCATINYAISQASSNYVIDVEGGTYEGPINVNVEGLTLTASGGATVNIPDGSLVDGFDISANNVTIEDFTINGPVTGSYNTYSWGSNVTRGIQVIPQATNYTFTIANNTITNVRNGILVNSYSNTGASITGNTIDNTKSAISFDYSDGTGVNISGNQQGTFGNDWGMNLHLNGYWNGTSLQDGVHVLGGSASPSAQTNVMNLSTTNGGWTVYDQAYDSANRSAAEVATSGSASNQGDPLGPLNTIQNGVNAVVAGGTVHVAAGIYNENVTVNKPLALDGAQAGHDARKKRTDSSKESIASSVSISNASNVKIDGFTFNRAGIEVNVTSTSTQSGIVVQNNILDGYQSVGLPTSDAGNILVQKNLFENAASSSEAIQIKANASDQGGCDGTRVLNNAFSSATNNGGSDVNLSCTGSNSSSVTVSGNTTTGTSGGSSFVGFSGVNSGIKVANNTGTTDGSSIFFFGNVSGAAKITDNSFTNGKSNAVSIAGGEDGTTDVPNTGTFTISKNDFSGNVRGVKVSSVALGAGGKVVATNNNLSGNSTAGAENDSSTQINANENWWGNISGPTDAHSGDGSVPDTNPGGTGSSAVGAVKYDPWCTAADCSSLSNTVLPAPTNLKPTDGTYTNNDQFDDSWSAVSGAVKYEYHWSASSNVDTNGALTGTIGWDDNSTNSPSNYDFLSDPGTVIRHNGPTTDGVYYWQVRAFSADGTPGQWSGVNKVTVDTQKPTVEFTATDAPTANGYYNGDFDVSWAAHDNDQLKVVNVDLFDTNSSHSNHWVATCYSNQAETTANDSSTCTVKLPAGLPDGTYYVQVGAQDQALNWSVNATRTIHVDRTAPTVPTGGLPNGTLEGTNDFYFTWNPSTDASPITYEYQTSQNPANAAGVLTTGVWDNIKNGDAEQQNLTTPTIHSTGAANGTWYWQVRACDAAGDCSAWSSIWNVTIDTLSPLSAPTLVSPSDGAYVNGTTLTNSWDSVTGAAKYEYESFNSDNTSSTPRYDATYTTTSKTATNVANGTVFYWRVRAIDAYGKVGAWSSLWEVTVDGTAPTAPTASPDPTTGPFSSTQLVTLTSSDSGSGLASIYYTTDGSTPSSTNGTLYTGAFSVSNSETVQAIAYDNAGNASPVASFSYTITTALVQSIVFPAAFVLGANATNLQNGGNGQVLGASTSTTNPTTTPQVLGDSTVNFPASLSSSNSKSTGSKNASNFLTTLHWWYLLILAALALFLFFLLFSRRRNSGENSQN